MKTRHQISVAGGRTLVAHSRSGEGVPVVFLHGLFGSGRAWTDVAAGLSQPVAAFDLPGFGDSDEPAAAELAAYAADVAAGLDALGLDRVELVGHSFGGAVAAALAELLGERVTALTLLAPAGFGRNPLVALAKRACRGPEQAATRALGSWRAAGTYRGPVTALWGSRDHVVSPAHARHLTAAFPQADVLVLGGADHHLVSASRDAVTDLLRTGRTPRRARRERSRRARRALRPSFPRFVPAPRFA